MPWSRTFSPSRDSNTSTVAVNGLSAVLATRVCHVPICATGFSGEMLVVATPTSNSAARAFTALATSKAVRKTATTANRRVSGMEVEVLVNLDHGGAS